MTLSSGQRRINSLAPKTGIPPLLPALPHIHQRLEAVVLSCDPLHVVGPVGASCAKGNHMIYMPARAGSACASCGGARVFCTKCAYLGTVTIYASKRW